MAKKGTSRKSGKGKKGSNGEKGKRPSYSIYLSKKKGKKSYINGPNFGLWPSDSDKVFARGSLKDERLEEVAAFFSKALKKDQTVGVTLFKSDKKKGRDEDDDDDDEEEDDDDDEENDDDDDDEEDDEDD